MQTSIMVMDYKDVMKDKAMYAYIFSEGNKHLESLLNFCFNNNIETFACCKGHIDNKNSFPYVGFAFLDNEKLIYSNLISLLSKSKINDYIRFRLYKYRDKYRLICDIREKYSKNRFVINKVFKALEDGLSFCLTSFKFDDFYFDIFAFYCNLFKSKSASINSFTLDNINSNPSIIIKDNVNKIDKDDYKLFEYLISSGRKFVPTYRDCFENFIYFHLDINDIKFINEFISKKKILKKD